VSTAPDDARVRNLIQAVEVTAAQGRAAESERMLAEARSVAPNHPLVLNEDGRRALTRGDLKSARELLERAIAADPKHPALWQNLASTFRGLRLLEQEAAALERVLALEPRNLPALLQKGSMLELQGKPRAAAQVYQNALATIPPGAQVPEVLRPALQRAGAVIRTNNEALETYLTTQLSGIRAQLGAARHDRFDHCLDALVGKRAVYQPQPTFLYFPKLPAYEFFAREDFPWLDEIEAATPEIRQECERILAQDMSGTVPYVAYPAGVPLDQWVELNNSRRWSAFFLWREGKRIEENIARCPRTAELLSRISMCEVPRHGPTAFFSILDRKTRIPPHTGVTNTRVIVHLPLVVPPGCRFRVGSEIREWSAGHAWVFDDSIEHEAINDSDIPRAILIFDIWNPYLSAAERELVRATVAAYGEYYGPDERPAVVEAPGRD
jgi:aspartyl/asparaginyl beta-hydroxylase (cupin superfamily)